MQQAQGIVSEKTILILRILFTCCLLATIIFIFFNSSQVGEISGGKSKAVMQWLNQMMEKLDVSFRFSEYLVRKLAHFAEFALLGFWLMLTLRVYTSRILAHISWPLFFGLLIPVADESLQLLVPNRAGQLQDVLIDFCGVTAGLCCGLFILLLFRVAWYTRQERKQKQASA